MEMYSDPFNIVFWQKNNLPKHNKQDMNLYAISTLSGHKYTKDRKPHSKAVC
jgi:hypothetical protein